MFSIRTSIVAILVSLAALNASADPQTVRPNPSSFSWDLTRHLVLNCAVQPVRTREDGRFESLPARSICPAELSVDGNIARFEVQKKSYTAVLTESEDSDGGDLNDLVIMNSKGRTVAREQNILAFGDILVALAGSADELRQVREDSSL